MTVLSKLNQHYDEVAHNHPNPMLVETARAMMKGYACRWEQEDSSVKVRGIEVPFALELPVPDDLPEEAKPTKPRYITGVIDSLIEDGGRVWGTDLKTASWPSDAYWSELNTNLQLSTYALALYMAGYQPDFVWDVLSKPGIKPKKLTKADVVDIQSGAYSGWPVTEGVPEDGQESPGLYGTRLFQWYLDNPTKFERRRYSRNEKELLDTVYWLHHNQHAVEDLQGKLERGWSHLPLRNYDQCSAYGSLCGFHPICSGRDSVKAGFDPRPVREGSFEVGISTSQLRCFSSCRQKWAFRYHERIEPKGGERSDATDLGSLCHAGREIVLGHRLENPIVLPLEQPVVSGSLVVIEPDVETSVGELNE